MNTTINTGVSVGVPMVPTLPSVSIVLPSSDPTPHSFTFTINGQTYPAITISWPAETSLPHIHVPKLPHYTPPSYKLPEISAPQPPTIDIMKMAVAAIVKAEISSIIAVAKAANGITYTLSEVIPTNVSVGVSVSTPNLP